MLAEPQALEAGGAGALGSQWAAQAPAHPSTPSSATRQLRLQPGLSFPLPGRAGLALRQPQHVEPPHQSSDRPACYLTLQRQVLPLAESHNQGLPGENSEMALCLRWACTAHSGGDPEARHSREQAPPQKLAQAETWDPGTQAAGHRGCTLCGHIQAHEGVHTFTCEPPRVVGMCCCWRAL